MGGGDEQRALRRDEAALDGARAFHQLGGEHDVDIARDRHQREHRRAASRLRGRFGEQFDVIDGGAGALRDARHRSGLRDPVLALRQRHDPVDQHAAALAAHRQHGDAKRSGLIDG